MRSVASRPDLRGGSGGEDGSRKTNGDPSHLRLGKGRRDRTNRSLRGLTRHKKVGPPR